MKKIFISLVIIATLVSCGQNETAKRGGTVVVQLNPNERFKNITWKENDDLWILTEEGVTEKKVFHFRQQKNIFSFYGNGEVIIKEQ